jgi:D-3-phosphoglycerate dehydrogenase
MEENFKMWNVMISDHIHQKGIDYLANNSNIQLFDRPGIERNELLELIGEMDGLVTRSGTAVDAELLSRAERLKVVARAGVGVDNIDLFEASKRGIIVINAPTGNTLSAADHTMALMLALIRNINGAFNSLKRGEWKRSKFTGYQLKGKTLLIIGLGRIGTEVARRARSFGMELLSYDPYIPEEKAEKAHAETVYDLEGALARADIITLHVPVTEETRKMVSEKELRACRKGAFLINCARGELVDVEACAQAIREGKIGGAAFDVYEKEPPEVSDNPLFAEDISEKVVLTPHLGANTFEAQSSVAMIAVENMLSVLENNTCQHAVNLPFMENLLENEEKQYLSLARKEAFIAAHLLEEPVMKITISMMGPAFNQGSDPVCFELPYKLSPFSIAALKGLLEFSHGEELTYMSAPLIAIERGLKIEETRGESKTYNNLLEITIQGNREKVRLRATVTEEGKQRIISINGYAVDFVPEHVLLLFQNHDRPGVIGKIGSVLGDSRVNIANFALGRKNGSGLALGVMQIDDEVPEKVAEQLVNDADLVWIKEVDLRRDF